MIKNFVKLIRNEFKGYNLKSLNKDILSSITVAAVALPLALAFGVSSAATASAGLITAIIAGIVIGGLSGSSFQISGPTGAMAAILVSISAEYGIEGILLSCFLSGVLLVLASVLRLGSIVSYVPLPVITGFTSGIAVLIVLGQIGNTTGIKTDGGNFLEKIKYYISHRQDFNLTAFLIVLAVVLIMVFYPKKLSNTIPSSLAAIFVTTILNAVFSFNVVTVGNIPRTIILDDRLRLNLFNYSSIKALILPAISLATLGMIESLLCGQSAGRMKNEKIDSSQELMAQGIGNIIIPFFGGVPATAAIARTSVAIKAGSVTRLASVFHSIILLLSMFLLAPFMSIIPLSALAGVLLMTSWRMNDWKSIKSFFNRRMKTAIFQYLITMIATVVFDLTIAILLGVLFSIIMFIVMISKMQINITSIDEEKITNEFNTDAYENIAVVYLTGPLYFGTANSLNDRLSELSGRSAIILSMRGVPFADLTGVEVLENLCQTMKQNNIEVYFSSIQPKVMEMFKRCRIVEIIGEGNFYWSVDRVLNDISNK